MKKTGPTEADFERAFGLNRPQANTIYARSVRGIFSLESHQDIAAFAIAHGARPKEAAVDAGVRLEVLYAWMEDSAFKQRVGEIREVLLGPLHDEIRSSLSDAVHVVRAAMNQTEDQALALKAALGFLDRFGKSITQMAVTGPTTNVQINVAYPDLRAEALKRLEAHNNARPTTLEMEKDQDDE